jgi:hypothetical protein
MKPDQIQYMLTALESPRKELSKWEEDFLDSVRDYFERRRVLTERQADMLERIYTEKTA